MNDIKEIAKRHYEIMNSNYYEEEMNSTNEVNDDIRNMVKINNLPPFLFSLTPNIPNDYQQGGYSSIKLNYNSHLIYLFIKSKFLDIYGGFTYQFKEVAENDVIYYQNERDEYSTYENPYIVLCCFIENGINPSLVVKRISSYDDTYVKCEFTNGNVFYINKRNKKIVNEIKKEKEKTTNNEQEESEIVNYKHIEEEYIKEQMMKKKNNDIKIDEQKSEAEIEKEQSNAFIEMLKSKNIKTSDTYESILDKIKYERAYKAIESEEKKNELYNKYVTSLSNSIKKKEMSEKNKKNQIREYKLFLKSQVESGKILLSTTYTEFSSENEDNEIFTNTEEDIRELLFNELKLKLKKLNDARISSLYNQFTIFLRSSFPLSMISSSTTIEDIKKKVKKDKAYYMIASKTQRDKLITDYLSEMKKLKSISSSTNDIDLLSEEYNKKEFTQMLISKIDKPITFEEAQNKLSSDQRWTNIKDQHIQIELFKSFIGDMKQHDNDAYMNLLNDKIGLNENITWHDAQHLLQSLPIYRRVQPSDRERMFTEYKSDILNKIITQFDQLCDERPDIINKDTIIDGEAIDDVIRELSFDPRCIRMATHPDKRDKIIRSKVKELKFKASKDRKKNVSKTTKRNFDETWEKGHVI